MFARRVAVVLATFFVAAHFAHAEFITRPIQVSMRTDNGIRITKSFIYVDPKGRKWLVPSNTISDGASIPHFFWSILGGPLDGQYRDAAFIHDYYYAVRTRKKEDVDKVFFDAMLELGIDKKKAFIMWKAVEWFGRTWNDPKENPICEDPRTPEDFDLCSENSSPPKTSPQNDSPDRVDDFIRTFRGQANAEDITRLIIANDARKKKK